MELEEFDADTEFEAAKPGGYYTSGVVSVVLHGVNVRSGIENKLTSVERLFLCARLHMNHSSTRRMSATPPRDMPTPRPIWRARVLPLLLAGVVPDSADAEDDAREVATASSEDRDEVVDRTVFVEECSVVEAGAEVFGFDVAPIGVKRELVTTAVLSSTDEPTRSEYSGKKSSMSCVWTPVLQLQKGPSTQQ